MHYATDLFGISSLCANVKCLYKIKGKKVDKFLFTDLYLEIAQRVQNMANHKYAWNVSLEQIYKNYYSFISLILFIIHG